MKTFVIDPDKWYAGHGGMYSRLIRSHDGQMCCLGFASCQLDINPKRLIDKNTPASLVHREYTDGGNRQRLSPARKKIAKAFLEMGMIQEVKKHGEKHYAGTYLVGELVRINDEQGEYLSKEARVDALNAACVKYNAPFRFALKAQTQEDA